MSIRNFESLMGPRRIVVVGASNRPLSIGHLVMRNLLQGDFGGAIYPVHPRYESVAGVHCYPTVEDLPAAPDLAVLCTPPATIPGLIAALGAQGARAAIVVTAGLGEMREESGRTLKQAMLDAARPYRMRILGHNTVGLIVPRHGVNATFAHTMAQPGNIAFVAQSGGMATTILDYAVSHGIGFSHFISLGDTADVDFGDCLDYLRNDPDTRSILLYIEAIRNARKFMSAARAASRHKPILALKSGRAPEGARAAASHTGSMAGNDSVYDAVFHRTGCLRVYQLEELFDAAETLARSKPTRGARLAILTNGGGPGVIAADAIALDGGELAELSAPTMAALDAMLPRTWSRGNPVDMIGDTPGEYYGKALRALLDDPGVDAALVMQAPVSLISTEEAARGVAEIARASDKPVLTCWLGDRHQAEARRLLRNSGIPTYNTPEQACRAFMQLVRHRNKQILLKETPASIPDDFSPDTRRACAIVQDVLAQGRAILTEPEAKNVLAAYGIPVVETRCAATVEAALQEAETMGYPVALKILSPDISHKTDVGGIALDIENAAQLRDRADSMLARVRALDPAPVVKGFTVQRMARRPGAHELIMGMAEDPVFGPVLLFGQGGTSVEVVGDYRNGFPPLNMCLARDMVEGTRVARLLRGYRDRPPANMDAICLTLVKLSQLIVDVPEIVELDINPIWADEHGTLALDARIAVRAARADGPQRLAIRPYPRELEESATLSDGRRVILRPIRPEDEEAHQRFFTALTPRDVEFRFLGRYQALPHAEMAHFTQIDYDREMAFIATAPDAEGRPQTLGVVRAMVDPDQTQSEFALVVRPDLRQTDLTRHLMKKMLRYLVHRRIGSLFCRIRPEDRERRELAAEFGFATRALPDTDHLEIRLEPL
jgi:acetyltransferase